ncbi:MAG: hypothetical protein HUK11_08915 [Muribaculaceae bacterium]|nr:hypothetical protein [Muribaculaceae bacterium]
MAYQTTTTTSYGTRVGNSFKAIGTGFIMFLAGTVLLWWNEGNFVKTQKMLEEAQGNAVHVESVAKIDPSNEGQLIHATDKAITQDSLVDQTFGVGVVGVRLQSNVEYYQWVEHQKEEKRDKLGGGEETITTYTYSKEWVNQPVSSSSFADPEYKNIDNNVLMTVEEERLYAKEVKFGAYMLSENLIHGIGATQDLDVNATDERLAQIDKQLTAHMGGKKNQVNQAQQAPIANDSVAQDAPVEVKEVKDYEMLHVQGNQIYIGKVFNGNNVGDVRIKFQYVPNNLTVSLIAKVQGNTFVKYVAKNGRQFDRIEVGNKSMEEMFQSANDENSMMTWILRIVGILLVIGGLKGIFGILTTLLKVVPFLASIMNFGVGLICSVVGFAWSLIIIALAWLFYRPVIGIIIIAIAGAAVYFFAFKGKSKPAVEPAPAPAPAPEQPKMPDLPNQQ